MGRDRRGRCRRRRSVLARKITPRRRQLSVVLLDARLTGAPMDLQPARSPLIIEYAPPAPKPVPTVPAQLRAPGGLLLLLVFAPAVWGDSERDHGWSRLATLVAAVFLFLKLRQHGEDPWLWRAVSSVAIVLSMLTVVSAAD